MTFDCQTDEVAPVDVAERLAENLARRRQAAGLSQEELAARASVNRSVVSLIESRKRMPRVDTLVKLAGGLGVSPAALLEGVRWRPGHPSPGGFAIAEE